MKRKLYKGILSTMLAVTLVFGSAFTGNAGINAAEMYNAAKVSEIVSGLSQEQTEVLQNTRADDAVPVGLAGFEDEYALIGDELVSVVVEFKAQPAVTAQFISALRGTYLSDAKAEAAVTKEHKAFNSAAKEKGITVNLEYSSVFNGASITLPASQVSELAELDMIYGIYPDYIIEIENNEAQDTDAIGDESADSFGYPGMYDSDLYLGLSDIHKTLTGKGVTVGVCDTGIDYNHPDLKDAYIGGYDFVNNDDDPMETTYLEWKASGQPETNSNGSEYYTDHGTHVSGTIAGTGKSSNAYVTTGVAPEAKLYVYKVLGPYGSGYTSWIMAGVEQAVKDGCEVINLSLGANLNQPWYISNTVMNNVALAGVVPCVSAGNNGLTTTGSLGSPGASDLAISVAAAQIDTRSTNLITVNNNVTSTLPLQGMAFKNKMVVLDNGYTVFENAGININYETGEMAIIEVGATSASSFTGKDVTGKIVIFSSVGTENTFLAIKNLVQDRGGCGIILTFGSYNAAYLAGLTSSFPYMSMTASAGTAFINAFRAANPTRDGWIRFTSQSVVTKGGILASFSSTGPVGITKHVKPDVAAPGVNILSTAPYYINAEDPAAPYDPDFNYETGYQYMSGTSMSCPHVTGMAALLVQQEKEAGREWTPIDIKARLMNTANDSFFTTTYTVFQKGAGMTNLKAAIAATTLVKSDVLALNYAPDGSKITFVNEAPVVNFERVNPPTSSSTNYTDTKEVRVENISGLAKTYALTYKYSGTTSASLQYFNFSGAQTKNITVNANSTETFDFSYSIPQSGARSGSTYYSYAGWILLTNTADSTDVLRVPFQMHFTNSSTEDYVNYAYFTRPAVSYGADAYSAESKYSDLKYSVNGRINYVTGYVSNYEDGEDIGVLAMRNKANTAYTPMDGTFTSLATAPTGGVGNIPNAFTGYYYPYIDDNYNIGTVAQPIPEGIFEAYFEFAYSTGGIYDFAYDYLYVDNTAPVLTLENGTSISSPIYYADGETTVTITGNVFDAELANAVASGDHMFDYGHTGVSINQGYNAVLADGMVAPLNVNADGTFAITIPVPTGSRTEAVAVNVYGIDLYGLGDNGTSYGLNKTAAQQVYVMMRSEEPVIALTSFTAENGAATATLNDEAYTPAADEFTLQYSINGGNILPLDFTATPSAGYMEFAFLPFEKTDVAQNIVIYVTFEGETMSDSFIVEALPPVEVNPIDYVGAANGWVYVMMVEDLVPELDEDVVADFALTYSINGSDEAPLAIDEAYSFSIGYEAYLFFEDFERTYDEQVITINVSYKGSEPMSDSFILEALPPVLVSVSAVNGKVTAFMNKNLTTAAAVDFAAAYSINGSDRSALTITGFDLSENEANLYFEEFPTTDEEQVVTVYVSYKGGTTLNGSFTIAALPPVLVSFSAENGSALAVLEGSRYELNADDFTLEYSINGGARLPLDFTAAMVDGVVKFEFETFVKSTIAQNIVIYVTFRDVTMDDGFTLDRWAEATSMKLSASALVNIKKGQTYTVTVTSTPENAFNDAPAEFTWTSSNANIASVANGVVTGVAPGTIMITLTVKTPYRTLTAVFTVKVSM